jgi:hypothetical protein
MFASGIPSMAVLLIEQYLSRWIDAEGRHRAGGFDSFRVDDSTVGQLIISSLN